MCPVPNDHAALEDSIRASALAGRTEEAATRALRGYGPELFGFLVAMEKSEQDAMEIFSLLSEDLWRGLPGFAWRSSFRTWAYTLARNAAHRHRKRRAGKGRETRLRTSMASRIAESVATSYARKKTALDALRDELPDEDRMILVLRVDRELGWNDIAMIVMGDNQGDLARESARLRKRFQLIKRELVAQGRAKGWIATSDAGG